MTYISMTYMTYIYVYVYIKGIWHLYNEEKLFIYHILSKKV